MIEPIPYFTVVCASTVTHVGDGECVSREPNVIDEVVLHGQG